MLKNESPIPHRLSHVAARNGAPSDTYLNVFNIPIETMMNRLPHLYQITPEPALDESIELFMKDIELALDGGIRLLQLRSRLLEPTPFRKLAERVARRCETAGATLILSGPIQTGEEGAPWGYHLTSSQLMRLAYRPVGPATQLSAACHNRQEIDRAVRLGVDFATLSSVMPSKTNPHAVPMGWSQFRRICEGITLPIFALGGLTPRDLPEARLAGAHGVAAIHGLWHSAFD